MIVASSSASLTAQRFAAEHPGRTLGLVFIGAPRSLRDKPGAAELLAVVRGLSDPIDPAFVRDFVEAIVSGPVPPAFLETMIAESLKVPARVWEATLEGLVEAVPASETAAITAPTVIVWGDRDGFLPRSDQEALAAAIPDRGWRSTRARDMSSTGSSPNASRPTSSLWCGARAPRR